MIDRRQFIATSGAAAAALAGTRAGAAASAGETLIVQTNEEMGALPHVWEESVGSDRAAITLREEWRRDLRLGVAEAGFKRVRFHGIFNDELGVYGNSILERRRNGGPNWQNIYRVYDGLLENGASPFVELSFMPGKLASGDTAFGFYKGNITPPKSDAEYGEFIKAFTAAMVERYGVETVRAWPFEVWNEANLPFFWTGDRERYFQMYKAAVSAIKSVDPAIKVGGPATSRTAWLSEMADWCAANNAPIDFFSTHAYAGDDQKELFGDDRKVSINDAIPEAMRLARQKIDAGPFSGAPLWLTEWSSDSPAMIAHVIKHSMGYCAGMSQWTLSAMFEELGVDNFLLKEGSMGWGMVVDGIAKPSFNTYRLLHRLGDRRLAAKGPLLASRNGEGKVSAMVWNLAVTGQPGGIPGMTAERTVEGQPCRFDVQFDGARGGSKATVTYVDWERGSPMPAWRAMGYPQYPTREQVQQLRRAAQPVVEQRKLDGAGRLSVDLPPEGVALIELA